MKDNKENPLHLTSINHISLICRSVEESIDFYHQILGFIPIRRPGSFDFDGAWLFGYGIGIHLLQAEEPEKLSKKTEINPKDNHISFHFGPPIFPRSVTPGCLGPKDLGLQTIWDPLRPTDLCESMGMVEKKLKEMEIKYVRARVEEGGVYVDQLFFHDPDGFMIEICNCDNLPVIPLAGDMLRSCSRLNLQLLQQQQQHVTPMIQQ